jgi:3D (Asp-Asp-Asp) domain-containing protein
MEKKMENNRRRRSITPQAVTAGVLTIALAGNVMLGGMLIRQKQATAVWEAKYNAAKAIEIDAVQAYGELLGRVSEAEEPEVEPVVEEPVDVASPPLESIGTFTVTAYCACEVCCGKWADGITASGTVATEGRTVAADPSVLTLGEVIYMEGLDGLIGGFVVEDTGAGITGNRLDIFIADHQAATEYGVRELEVYQIKN